jgi:hypothetical protein
MMTRDGLTGEELLDFCRSIVGGTASWASKFGMREDSVQEIALMYLKGRRTWFSGELGRIYFGRVGTRSFVGHKEQPIECDDGTLLVQPSADLRDEVGASLRLRDTQRALVRIHAGRPWHWWRGLIPVWWEVTKMRAEGANVSEALDTLGHPEYVSRVNRVDADQLAVGGHAIRNALRKEGL